MQDISIATLLNASVALPHRILSRKSCHFKASCFKQYVVGPPLWEVFDKNRTLAALSQIVCIQKQNFHQDKLLLKLFSSAGIPASSIQKNSSLPPLVPPETTYWLGEDCCGDFRPDTKKGLDLLRAINAAFVSASPIVSLASHLKTKFHLRTCQEISIALHWRLNADFQEPTHALNGSDYLREVCTVLNEIQNDNFTSEDMHVILLGDANREETMYIENTVQNCSKVHFHSKSTLMPQVDFDAKFDSFDDWKGQVDFELGLQSDIFIGSPFSSFSANLAFHRSYLPCSQQHGMASTWKWRAYMVNVDASRTKIGRTLKMLLPYDSPCSADSES